MNGGFRVRPDGQFVADSLNARTTQKGIQEAGKINETQNTVAQTNQLAGVSPLPSISLPKGGGAIRGIGEKFTANPVTGTGSLNVPIFTSPGRSGFGPQLSLSYDSGSGNGPFGFGWSLSLPSITRKTDKGLPKYEDTNESDVFVLSGAEDLVPVFKKDQDGNWVRDAKGNLIFDEEERDDYVVRRYCPRIEGLFACIERWMRKDDRDTHWRSISKDNILTVYGRDEQSRIADPADKSRIFSWLICESYDDKGNTIVYEYATENGIGIDLSQANEHNRLRTANRYLKRIKYGNRKPLLLDTTVPSFRKSHISQPDFASAGWMFEVVFDYGENHYKEMPYDNDPSKHKFVQASASAGGTWSSRPDPFSIYRSGFEVRTYRRCQRVLMFHRFKELFQDFPELEDEPYLVRSIEFDYKDMGYEKYKIPAPVEDELKHKGSTHFASFIQSVTQSGYVRDETRLVSELNSVKYLTYLKKSLPPLEFQYSQATIQEEIKEIDSVSLENLPEGVDGVRYQWVDLDGEGVSGILTEQAEAWFYKSNLGGGNFGTLEMVATKPSVAALSSGRTQLLDLAGDGQLDVVELERPVAGFYERTRNQNWENFIPFTSLPNVFWNDPNLKFVDLTGDGHADVMITEDEVFTWYPSLAEEGFGPAEKVHQSLDEEKGPRLVFADGTQSIYLSDMSGDGLSDLVRIRNGEVCYWPNLGYGRFGAKVTMDNAPWFDYPDLFDQKRIRLADVDGSGNTDIIYLGRNGVQIYFNRSGNSYSSVRTLFSFPRIDNLSSVQVADLLGNGTACLVWSSPLPCDSRRPMRYIDLMGSQKPHLLVNSKNNLGAETIVQYAASTKFYLKDKAEGKPWITRIPFPVHVVERVETYDYISRNRFVTRYAYHHGYFDGIEREFRGFGMVEQRDTEEFATLSASDAFPSATNIDEASHVPLVLTRTWFHTGAYLEENRISRHFEDEYYRESDLSEGLPGLSDEQLNAMLLDDTVLPDTIRPADGMRVPFVLSAEETREACRALKGSILRQEIYALDGTDEEDRPYRVSERNYTIELLQPRGSNRHAVFFAHSRETIDFHYERMLYDIGGQKLADPRVSHAMTLEVDEFGNVLQSVAIGYRRRHDNPLLTEDDRKKQKRTLVTCTENKYTNLINQDDAYRTPLPCETRTYELLKFEPKSEISQVTNLFRFDEMVSKVQSASDGLHDLPYEQWKVDEKALSAPSRRLIEHVCTLYRKNDLTGCLPLRQLESLALICESYKLALTPDLLTQVYSDRVTDAMLSSDGWYVHRKGDPNDPNWWIPSGQTFYSPNTDDIPAQELAFAHNHFFLPQRFLDIFGQTSRIGYDGYDLFLEQTTDPLGNVTAAENDYRMMQPNLIMDPNGNRVGVVFDAVGLVVGTAVMGKTSENKGDLLDGFEPDLNEANILAHMQNPTANPHKLLQKATSRLVYDLYAYHRTQHNPQPKPAVVYTLAREIHDSDLASDQLTKIQHSFSYSDGFGREIQKKIQAEQGQLIESGPDISPRWVGSGWTIFNNKGKPVKKYEPFFDVTHDFRFGKKLGVSSTLFYDPTERVVATLHPNKTYEKVIFDPWWQEIWDMNDTVQLADPKNDPYVGDFFLRLQDADYLPTWYESRKNGQQGPAEQSATQKAAEHAKTPTVIHLDTLGRSFLTVADNGTEGKYLAHVELDIEGNQRTVIDSNERIVMRYDYDMLGNRIKQESMEAGTRWMLNNAIGKPIRTWDSRGFKWFMTYDALQRPAELFVTDATGTEFLAEKTEYGEFKPNPVTTNHRLKPWKVYDGAGVLINDSYDFKDNLLVSRRQLLSDYKAQVDWAQNPQLENETFTSRTLYDALNRPIQIVAPHSSKAGTKLNVTQPVYNEANLLERIEVWLEQNAEPDRLLDPHTATQHAVKNIDYNAKGQRKLIEYGNRVKTTYNYDDETFRLIHLITVRGSERLQDLFYTYDPVGNITAIRDDAQQTIYFNGQVVRPDAEYTYDSVYRLIGAKGREHTGQASQPQPTWNNEFRFNLAHPNDGQKMRNYSEFYTYDEVGNILSFDHKAQNGNWIRTYDYNEASLIEMGNKSNRLSRTVVHPNGQQPITEPYTYDPHGNMTSMAHLRQMEWDFKDQLHYVEKGFEKSYYIYDVSGQRVRKVVEKNNGALIEERIYLGGFEIFRRRNGGSEVTLERETLHIMDDKQRIAMLETRTIDTQNIDQAPRQVLRYQFGNYLGSAILELDDQAQIISYEEYYPYGSTSYQAVRSQTETSKRYRYTGKEQDEESGFYYHGARYYASWLGRWVSADPAGLADGVNLYAYTRANPIMQSDPTGLQSEITIYHRTTEEGARSMIREGVSTTRSRPHVWAGSGFYATGSSDIPSSVGSRGDTVVAQQISTERMVTITDQGFIRMQQDTPEGRELRSLTRQQMRDRATQQLRTQGRMPSDADIDLRMRDYMSSQMDRLAPGADVVRWQNPDGTYTYVVRQQSALQGRPTVAGRMTGGRFQATESSAAPRAAESAATPRAAAAKTANEEVPSGRAGSVGGKALGAANAVANVWGAYMMARDTRIAEQSPGYAGVAILEDENGQYTLQMRQGIIFNDYSKTYISGKLQGKTLELGFFQFYREIKKRNEKYGHFDWKGDFVPGKVPPIIVHRPQRNDMI